MAASLAQLQGLTGLLQGRELTRKERRLRSSFSPADALLQGGLPRGRISELTGPRSSGKTSLAAAFIANACRAGEVVAVIDLANSFDPATMAQAGVELDRVLWINPPRWQNHYDDRQPRLESSESPQLQDCLEQPEPWRPRRRARSPLQPFLRATELVLEAGGFGLVVMDLGESPTLLSIGAALRLARLAERSGSAILTLAARPVCGTFAALNVALRCKRALFSATRGATRGSAEPIYLFEGLGIEAVLRRNKMGPCGAAVYFTNSTFAQP